MSRSEKQPTRPNSPEAQAAAISAAPDTGQSAAPDTVQGAAPDTVQGAAPDTAPARMEQAQAVGATLTENPGAKDKLKRERFIKEARAKIKRAYNRKKTTMTTPMAEMREDLFVATMQYPVEQLAARWKAEKRAGGNAQELEIQYRTKINAAVKTAEQYLERMTRESGWVTPEVLARMTRGASERAGVYAELLLKEGAGDLIEAFQWAIGMQGRHSSMSRAREAAIATLERRIPQEFSSDAEGGGTEGLMPCIWMVLALMSRADRLLVTQNYLKSAEAEAGADAGAEADVEAGASAEGVEAFLNAGNRMGVFGPEEMETVRGQKYDEATREVLAARWKAQNDFSKEAKRIMSNPTGSTNAADRMLTLKNTGLFLAQFAGWATISMNFLVSFLKGGRLSMPTTSDIAAFAKNEYVLVAAAGLTGIHVLKSPERLGQVLASKEERATLATRQAIEALSKQRQEADWPKWDGFFRSLDFAGAQAFADYTREVTKVYGGQRPKDRFTGANFLDYLRRRATAQADGKKLDRNINYQELADNFAATETVEIAGWGDIFEKLNQVNQSPGGVDAGTVYERLLKETDKV